jgi:deoxycytidylate deaminase
MNGSVHTAAWNMARIAATFSTCQRRQVGAVLIPEYNRVGRAIRIGWNTEMNGGKCNQGGCPRGRKSFDEQPAYAPYDDCVARHAEMVCLSELLGFALIGYTLYVTEEPCSDCWAQIDKFVGLRVLVLGRGVRREGVH